jgi:hypothetical protein
MSDIRSSLARKASAAFTAQETTVFVDVGARKVDANITRDGVAISALPIDDVFIDDFFTGRPQIRTKVVSQSVPAGTPVPIGTAIDLVLAPPFQLPIGIVEGVHVDLRQRTLGSLYDQVIADDTELRRVLARNATADALTANDEAIVLGALNQLDIFISEEPGRDVAAGFQALKAGFTFGT